MNNTSGIPITTVNSETKNFLERRLTWCTLPDANASITVTKNTKAMTIIPMLWTFSKCSGLNPIFEKKFFIIFETGLSVATFVSSNPISVSGLRSTIALTSHSRIFSTAILITKANPIIVPNIPLTSPLPLLAIAFNAFWPLFVEIYP